MTENISISLSWMVLIILILVGIVLFLNASRSNLPAPLGYVFVVLTLLDSGKSLILLKSDLLVINYFFATVLLGVVLLRRHLPFIFCNRNRIVKDFFLALALGLVFGMLSSLTLSPRSEQTTSLPIITSLLIISQKSFGEEILYRGFLMGYLKQSGLESWTLALTQSLLFVLPHFISYWNDPIKILWTFVFGLTVGYFTLKENNIFMATTMHIVINIVVFLAS